MRKFIFALLFSIVGFTAFAQQISATSGYVTSMGAPSNFHKVEVYPFDMTLALSSRVSFDEDFETDEDFDYNFGLSWYPNFNTYWNLAYNKITAFNSDTFDLSLYGGYTWTFDNVSVSVDGGGNYYSYGDSSGFSTWDINRLYFNSSVKVSYNF